MLSGQQDRQQFSQQLEMWVWRFGNRLGLEDMNLGVSYIVVLMEILGYIKFLIQKIESREESLGQNLRDFFGLGIYKGVKKKLSE